MTSKVVADSVSVTGDRLTTIELTIPSTHYAPLLLNRMLSVSRFLPLLPAYYVDWVEKQPAKDPPPPWALAEARKMAFLDAYDFLSPWSTTEVLISATEWDHAKKSAFGPLIEPLLYVSKPRFLRDGEWHLPYVELEDSGSPDYVPFENRDRLVQISVERCARSKGAYEDAIQKRFFRLFEHPAQCIGKSIRVGNFVGWKQHRKFFPDEWLGRPLEVKPPTDAGWTPFYARMEAAFKEFLVSEWLDDRDSAMEHLSEFFPREAEKLMKQEAARTETKAPELEGGV